MGLRVFTTFAHDTKTCGSELIRDDASTSNTTANCPSAIASKLAPTVGSGVWPERQVGCQTAFASGLALTMGSAYDRESQVGY
jgi:hypothetical protein